MTQRLVLAEFAGEEHRFLLRAGEVAELEQRCGCGVAEIASRLVENRYHQRDIVETVRLALEGGGMPSARAAALKKRYLDDAPLADHAGLAARILGAVISGAPKVAATDAASRAPGDLTAFYEVGGALGFTPDQMRAMTFGEIEALVAGARQAQGGPASPPRLTPEQAAQFQDVLAAEMAAGRVRRH